MLMNITAKTAVAGGQAKPCSRSWCRDCTADPVARQVFKARCTGMRLCASPSRWMKLDGKPVVDS